MYISLALATEDKAARAAAAVQSYKMVNISSIPQQILYCSS